MLSVRTHALKQGASATVWEIRSGLTDSDTGGTSAVVNVYGTNVDAPDERILLNILGAVARWIYGRAEKEPGSTERRHTSKKRLPHRLTIALTSATSGPDLHCRDCISIAHRRRCAALSQHISMTWITTVVFKLADC